MNRWVLLVIPFATCALVSIAVFVVGAPAARPAARVYGGATEGLPVLAWSLEVTRPTGAADGPASDSPVAVEVRQPGCEPSRWQGFARAGRAELVIPLARPADGPLDVHVRDGAGRTLARGRVFLGRAEWWARARRSGGWLDGVRAGVLDVDIAPVRGVFAVDFAEPFWIRVRRDGLPRPNVRIQTAAEGAELTLDDAVPAGHGVDTLDLVASEHGWARARLCPHGFDVTLTVRAKDGRDAGKWSGSVPVVAGALEALRQADRLVVRSSIPRPAAFYSIISPRGRLGGGELRLAPSRPEAVASVPIPAVALAEPELWAVVAAEPRLESSGAVGWPIPPEPAARREPLPVAMTLADQLLLDGRPQVRAQDAAQARAARILAGVFAAVAVALMAVLTLVQTTGARRRLEEHLARAGQSDDQVRQVTGSRHWTWVSVLAVVVIALGYAIVALVAMARIG